MKITSESDSELLTVKRLRVHFQARHGVVKAVNSVSFGVRSGEAVALVGESGCGKSVSALALARLVASPGFIAGGRIMFGGKDVLAMSAKSLLQLRGAELAYVFQDPSTSLNPVFRVGAQIAEAVRLHRKGVQAGSEAGRLLEQVGLSEYRARAYPHELSGGMQQRVMIAMALACSPKLLVADEPTTALDVTIQAQILDLLARLQRDSGMGLLLITHNLGLVADITNRVYVMYAGRIVECAPTEELLTRPAHPYTRGLLDAIPRISGGGERIRGIPGSVPDPANPPDGCRFHPRCPKARARCRAEEPALVETYVDATGTDRHNMKHGVRCHFWK